MSAIFNFQSLLSVILLLICTCTYLKGLFPSILDKSRTGIMKTLWKCARVGERKSPWISSFCMIMAVSILFFNNALDAVAWCTCGAGMGAGATAAITVTPCDVVKTRLQTIRKGRGEKYYSGIRDVFIKIWNREGWKAFFKGGACRIMVAAPMFGVTQRSPLGIAEYILGLEKHT